MTIKVYWTIDPAAEPARAEPSAWGGVRNGVARDVRPATINRYDYYAQVARAAELTGFDGLFIRHRAAADDSQIIAAVVARTAPRLKLVPEFAASVGSAVYAAKQAASFQRLAHDRLGWAIAPDASPDERAASADAVAEVDLDARLDEFLAVARGVHDSRPFTLKGRFFEVVDGGFEAPLNRGRFPTVHLSGDDEDALARSARLADVHLFGAQPIERLARSIETLDAAAFVAGRQVVYGVALSLSARETAQDPAAPADLTGTYDEVAAALAAYAEAGVSRFVLGGTPSLEEAYRIGEFVLPRLRAATAERRAA